MCMPFVDLHKAIFFSSLYDNNLPTPFSSSLEIPFAIFVFHWIRFGGMALFVGLYGNTKVDLLAKLV